MIFIYVRNLMRSFLISVHIGYIIGDKNNITNLFVSPKSIHLKHELSIRSWHCFHQVLYPIHE